MASPADELTRRLAGPWSDIQDNLQFLHDTVLTYPQAQVVELGTREGNSTSALLSAVIKVGGHLWSCDIAPRGPYPGCSFPPEWEALPEWTFINGNSVADEVLAQMPPEIDVLFADTSHTYDQTLAELRAYMPRLKPGGIHLQHDTQARYTPGGAREWTATPEVEGEVTRALDAYCEETGLTWHNRHSEATFYGLGVIELPRKATRRAAGHRAGLGLTR